MSDPVVTNIITRGAKLWYAPVGEAVPDETAIAFDDAWGGNWARLGYTKAPLAVAYESEEAEVTVEEHLGPLDGFLISEGLMVETTLAELTAAYLAFATGQDPSTDVTTTPAGASQVGFEELGVGDVAVLQKHAVGIEARYVDANGVSHPVRIFIWKASGRVNGNLEFSNKSGDYPGIPLQLKGYVDPSQASGERFWKWQRVTDPAT